MKSDFDLVTKGFLQYLEKSGQLGKLPQLAKEHIRLSRTMMDPNLAIVQTVIPLTKQEKQTLAAKLEKLFKSLPEEEDLKKYMLRAIEDIKENAFCGIRIPKRLFPIDYIKRYNVTNLWKYDLPDGWRLIYTVISPDKVEIVSVILEWFNHKNYERRFNY